ncbi:MAG: hypothetical protein H6760_04595 [Candidatus Nomurabacteria bacterium]|nr:MAG: hypothetical protein H6760_04595 [Candidatus Nomurabacteria bacterium]
MRYLIGGIVILIGALLVIKTDFFMNWFGRIEWAEQHLGTEGGTRIFLKLLGILMIFIVFLTLTGFVPSLLRDIFSPVSNSLN